MKSMQEYILEALDTEVQKNGKELVVNFDFQNNGTLFIMNGMNASIALRFDFQNSGVAFKSKDERMVEHFSFDEKDWPALRSFIEILASK